MGTYNPSTTLSTAGKLEWHISFAAVPRAALLHPSYELLSGSATRLLLAVLSSYDGKNNGSLVATASRMKFFGFRSKDSLSRAINELINFGFLVRTRTQVRRLPALYAITWLPINPAPKGMSYDGGFSETREAGDEWRHVDSVTAWENSRKPTHAALSRKLRLGVH